MVTVVTNQRGAGGRQRSAPRGLALALSSLAFGYFVGRTQTIVPQIQLGEGGGGPSSLPLKAEAAAEKVLDPQAQASGPAGLEKSGDVTATGGGPEKFTTPINRTEARINQQLIDDIFRGVDPFAQSVVVEPDWSYPHTNWRPDFFESLWTQYVRPNHGALDFYLEVGSFKGGSITRLADLLKKKCRNWKNVSLVCMDPFTGDVNMWDWNHQGGSTEYRHNFLDTGPDGRPRIFERFMANVADKGHQDMVLPVVVGGLVGMKLIDRFHQSGRIDRLPSVIYLDSAHEKDETFLELEQAWKILRECGAILGDDWSWDAVREDAMRFVMSRDPPSLPIYDKYKQPTPGLILGPNGQWFIIKIGKSCKFDANGTW